MANFMCRFLDCRLDFTLLINTTLIAHRARFKDEEINNTIYMYMNLHAI